MSSSKLDSIADKDLPIRSLDTMSDNLEDNSNLNSDTRKIKTKHKQVNVAEFMYKNIQMLGFENSQRVLTVAFRELMDNTLDACHNAQLLPEVDINLQRLDKKFFRLTFKDSGPGIDVQTVPNVCCRLLYGDKFLSNIIQRGQQGLGLTALILYCQKTTNKSARIITKTRDMLYPVEFILRIDIKKNAPIIVSKKILKDPNFFKDNQSGFYLDLQMEATYLRKGTRSPLELLQVYGYLNPHLSLYFNDHEGTKLERPRISTELQKPPVEVKKAPHFQPLGDFFSIVKNDNNLGKSVLDVLLENFEGTEDMYRKVLAKSHIIPDTYSLVIDQKKYLQLKKNIQASFDVLRPPKESVTYLDQNLIKVVTQNNTRHFDYVVKARAEPLYYENGIACVEAFAFYGGQTLTQDSKIELIRVSNGTPLVSQTSSCLITKSVCSFDWKSIGLTQTENELPRGKLLLILHVSSTKVPYVTESKDAIADNDTIKNQINNVLKRLSLAIKIYLRKEAVHQMRQEKKHVITKILPDLINTLREGLKRPHESSKSSLELLGRIMDEVCIFMNPKKDFIVIMNPHSKDISFNIQHRETLETYPVSVPSNVLKRIDINLDLKKYRILWSPIFYQIVANANLDAFDQNILEQSSSAHINMATE
jgi:DNA topoisomerase-6 subunit B